MNTSIKVCCIVSKEKKPLVKSVVFCLRRMNTVKYSVLCLKRMNIKCVVLCLKKMNTLVNSVVLCLRRIKTPGKECYIVSEKNEYPW